MVNTGAGTVVDGDWLAVDGVVVRLEAGMVFSEGTAVVGDGGGDVGMPASLCDGVLGGAKFVAGSSSPPAEARVITDVVVGVATAGAGPAVVVVVALATARAGRMAGVVAAAASRTVSC